MSQPGLSALFFLRGRNYEGISFETEYKVRVSIVQFSRAFKAFYSVSLKHKREKPLAVIFRLHRGSFLHSKSVKNRCARV